MELGRIACVVKRDGKARAARFDIPYRRAQVQKPVLARICKYICRGHKADGNAKLAARHRAQRGGIGQRIRTVQYDDTVEPRRFGRTQGSAKGLIKAVLYVFRKHGAKLPHGKTRVFPVLPAVHLQKQRGLRRIRVKPRTFGGAADGAACCEYQQIHVSSSSGMARTAALYSA